MHISHLCNIIARNVGILQKLWYFIPAYVLKILYHSLVLSHLQYCTLLWANSYHSHLHKLRLLQKKAIRIISNTDYLAHSSKLFFNLKLLKLDDIMKFQLGTFMYKLKYNKLPNVIPHMFVTNENIHSHNTRNKNGYLIPSVRTNCRKCTVGYAGPILWNSFPQKLRQLPSEVIFNKKLKCILLATYWITHLCIWTIVTILYKGIDTAAGCDLCFRTQSPAAHKTSLTARHRNPSQTTYLPNQIERTKLTLRGLLL